MGQSVFKLLLSGQVSYCAFFWCRRLLSAAWRLTVRFFTTTKGNQMKPNKSSVMLTDEAIQRLKTASDRSGTNLSVTVEQAIRATFKSNTIATMGKENTDERTEQ
jgi:hypothetical protein